MKSVFNTVDNAELLSRIDQLSPDTPALWGKMTTAQMMAHCHASMSMAFGINKKKRHWIGVCFGNFSKKRQLKVDYFDKHMPTFKSFEITDEKDFSEGKKKFTSLIKIALAKGEAGLIKYPHPYFGRFNPGEWSQLNWKHLDHHLRQFGC